MSVKYAKSTDLLSLLSIKSEYCISVPLKLSFELFLADFNSLEYKFFRKSLDHLKLDKN